MQTQNVTLTLPRQTLRQAKIVAAKRQTSVSGLMLKALEEMLAKETGYAKARARHLALINHAPDLGTRGKIASRRETLHER